MNSERATPGAGTSHKEGQPAAVPDAEGMHVGSAVALHECLRGRGGSRFAAPSFGLRDAAFETEEGKP